MEIRLLWYKAVPRRNDFHSNFSDLRLCQNTSPCPPAVEQILRGLGGIFGLVCDSQIVGDSEHSVVIRNVGVVVVVGGVIIQSIRAEYRGVAAGAVK